MNAKSFTEALRAYYGQVYTEAERQVIGPWLVRYERSGGRFDALFDAVTESVSKAFGKLPDKAQLAEAAKSCRPARDANALPPPPPREIKPLSDAEQAELEAGLLALMPGFRPSGRHFGQPLPTTRDPDAKPMASRLLGA